MENRKYTIEEHAVFGYLVAVASVLVLLSGILIMGGWS